MNSSPKSEPTSAAERELADGPGEREDVDTTLEKVDANAKKDSRDRGEPSARASGRPDGENTTRSERSERTMAALSRNQASVQLDSEPSVDAHLSDNAAHGASPSGGVRTSAGGGETSRGRAPQAAAGQSPDSATPPASAHDTSDSAGAGSGGRAPSDSSSSTRGRASGSQPNNVRRLRQEAMMSKAELARRAGVSPLTIDRVESGFPCRMDTKRKILEALGLSPQARTTVWPDIDQS